MSKPKVVYRKIEDYFYLIELIDKCKRRLPLFGVTRAYSNWFGAMVYTSDTHPKVFTTLKKAVEYGDYLAKIVYKKYM